MSRLTSGLVSTLVTVAVAAAFAGAALVATGRLGALGTLLAATAVVYLAVAFVGAAIVRADTSTPARRVGWLFLVSGAALPVSTAISGVARVEWALGRPGAAAWVDLAATPFSVLGVTLVATFGILLFPDGRLRGRGRRVLAWVSATDLLLVLGWGLLASHLIDLPTVVNPIGAPVFDVGVLTILVMGPLSLMACFGLLRRVRRDIGPHAAAVRSAARVSFLIPASFLACVVVGFSGGDTNQVGVVENCATLALGVVCWVGISRYGLFNARAVLSRALVYATLSLAMIAVYLTVVVGLGLFFTGLVPQVAAAVAAALVALPVRDRAQRRINQLVYGLRDDPAVAFARLGERLDAAAAPEDILPAAVHTVAEALRLRYAAIEVGGTVLARYGAPVPGPVETLVLPFAGETVGQLELQTRDGARFTAGEQRLLADLARQVAVAARAVALAHALQESRQRLVVLREEERRRLRRDLHDGMGPTLAGIALGIDTVRRSVRGNEAAAAQLAMLRKATEAAVEDIRRIVYDLRPPVLDELGLAGALREQGIRLGAAEVDVPPGLPALPAAVEVAAYRIAVEALTNAARHAPHAPVSVRLSVDGDPTAPDRLTLSVTDGGAGLPDGYRAGVGLTSMRERAAELGGTCVVEPAFPHGSVVRAELPLTSVGLPESVGEPA